ncbi:MAG: DVUA0089 family protein [Opitutaceae bacterium]
MTSPFRTVCWSLRAGFILLLAGLALKATAQVETGPAFTIRLFDAAVVVGQSFTLTTATSGFPTPEYQWYKNDIALPGQTGLSLAFPSIQFSDAGSYYCRARNAGGTAVSTTAVITVVPPPVGPFSRITNASVRTTLAASQLLTVGFTMQGGSRPVLMRAVGPSLGRFDVPNFMPNPWLAVFQGAALLEINDNWGDTTTLHTAFASVGAFALLPGSQDAALVRTVGGGHTVQVAGVVGGNVLMELYDLGSATTPRLVNISARNQVGTGANVLILGLTLAGTAAQPVLIRAVGPTLVQFGVGGVLADPRLTVFDSTGAIVAFNDDWDSTQATVHARSGAFALPASSKDSAVNLSLPPGSYTVQVSGANGGTGEALVELYELP